MLEEFERNLPDGGKRIELSAPLKGEKLAEDSWIPYMIWDRNKMDIDYITELLYDYYKEKRDYLKQKMLLNLIGCVYGREVKKWYMGCKDELYWKEVHHYISLGKEKNYCHAVSVLREIRQIMKGNKWTENWNRQYQQFLNENQRKKLLIKELGKL